jgi:CO/xanthine dehydrogenase FAD-binding subunit
MILQYHRPQTVEDALELLAREEVISAPMGGGTVLNQPSPEPIEAIDLQALALNRVMERGNWLDCGATSTLQQLLGIDNLQPALRQVIELEATYNLRQVATVAGTLISASGRSPFATACLASDISLTIMPGKEQIGYGELLPLRNKRLKGRLITRISLPITSKLVFEYVARTPADLPQVCVAVARWPSGRTRVALGGYGQMPVLAMDGPESDGAEIAAGEAYREASDEWASAEFRQDVAKTLTLRCMDVLLV